jgi:hypothetical protein
VCVCVRVRSSEPGGALAGLLVHDKLHEPFPRAVAEAYLHTQR